MQPLRQNKCYHFVTPNYRVSGMTEKKFEDKAVLTERGMNS